MQKQRIILLALVLSIMLVGTLIVVFVLRPSIDSYGLAKEESLKIKGAYEENVKIRDLAKTIQEQIETIAPAEIEKLNAMFLGSPELPTLVTMLSKRVEDSRLNLVSLAIGSGNIEKVQGAVEDTDIQMQVKGGRYVELRELLRLITRSTPVIEVKSFTFTPETASASLNLAVKQMKEKSSIPQAIDVDFFKDSRFKGLASPVMLPDKDPVGRENPFAKVEVVVE